MVGSVSYMHSNGVAHRDLKPANFLLGDKTGLDKTLVKMTDFGLSKSFVAGKKMASRCGTLAYVAPEVLQGAYDERCDVWSLGVIMFVILSGVNPFKGDGDSLRIAVMRGSYSFKGARWSKIS